MAERIAGMLRVEHGWGKRRDAPRLVITRSQNRKYERDVKPYRHAALSFRLGPVALNCVVHNDHGHGFHKTIAYWEVGEWGISLPRSPVWKMKPYQ